MNLRNAWEKYSQGDHITDVELDDMTQQLAAAMPYLSERPGYDLAIRDSANTLVQLEGCRRARQLENPQPKRFRVAKDVGREIGVDYLATTGRGLIFVHPRHLNASEQIFEASFSTCREIAATIGDGCYTVEASAT